MHTKRNHLIRIVAALTLIQICQLVAEADGLVELLVDVGAEG